jgi:excisionase family DNA binding protein
MDGNREARMPQEGGGLLRAQEAARFLAMSVRNLQQLTHNGAVRCVRKGRRWVRYTREDLVAFIDGHRTVQEVNP